MSTRPVHTSVAKRAQGSAADEASSLQRIPLSRVQKESWRSAATHPHEALLGLALEDLDGVAADQPQRLPGVQELLETGGVAGLDLLLHAEDEGLARRSRGSVDGRADRARAGGGGRRAERRREEHEETSAPLHDAPAPPSP